MKKVFVAGLAVLAGLIGCATPLSPDMAEGIGAVLRNAGT